MPSLKINYAWMLTGTVGYAACQWGMLASLAKLCSPEVVGQFALALAITAPIIMLANMNLRAIQASDTRREIEFSNYFAMRLLALTAACVAILAVSFGTGYRGETLSVIGMVTLTKVFDSISDVIYGLELQHEQMEYIAISRLTQGLLQLGSLALLVYWTRSLFWGCVGMTVFSALVTFAYDFPKGSGVLRGRGPEAAPGRGRPSFLPTWSGPALARLARLGMPLGIAASMWILHANVPRYYVDHYLGRKALGVFAAMSWIMVVLAQFVMATLVQSLSPRMAASYQRDRATFWKLIAALVGVGAVAGVVGVAVALARGREIMTLLYKPEYGEEPAAFAWLMAAAGVYYIAYALEGGLMAMRRFDNQLPLSVLVVGATCLACVLFIPGHGIVGAAWASFAGMVVKMAGNLIFLVLAAEPWGLADARAPHWPPVDADGPVLLAPAPRAKVEPAEAPVPQTPEPAPVGGYRPPGGPRLG